MVATPTSTNPTEMASHLVGPTDPRLSRTPLLIAVGVLFFLLGVGVRGSPFKTKIGPDLALAIRIRVLNSLVRERYPVT